MRHPRIRLDRRCRSREQTRARYPDSTGHVQRDGVRLYYEVYGSGEQTVFLLPTWSIIHSRHWKMQIPYLARAGRHMDYDSADSAEIANAIASEIGRPVDYRPVTPDGAARAAAMLADLL